VNDFDRLIDNAAEQMVRREPSAGLTRSVMARITGAAPRAGRSRLLWGGMAAAAAIVAVVVIALNGFRTQRAEQPPMTTSNRSASAAQSTPPPKPAVIQNFVFDKGTSAHRGRASETFGRATVYTGAAESPVAAILIDPISSPQLVQVPAVDVASTAVEQIEIEPIYIEPISASND